MTISNFIQKRLDEYASYITRRKQNDFGYPINHNNYLAEFYKWYLSSGAYNVMANNAGDPFNITYVHLNTLDFEREVIDFFGPQYGFDSSNLWGIITSSGTDGNNHGLYFGSKYLEKKTKQKPIVYVSDAAHYSNLRLTELQNLKLILVPSDEHGCMIPEELDKLLVPNHPALMVYAIGTTFKGGIDNQESLNSVLEKHPSITVYRHIDAALFGGYLPYTKYADTINRNIHPYDSIAISGHKFFGLDEPAGIFLTTLDIKNNQNPYNISYVNGNMPMISCSRSAITPLKLWWLIKNIGITGFKEQASKILELATWLYDELNKLNYPVWKESRSNIVYFKKPTKSIREKYDLSSDYDSRLGGELSHIVVMQHVTKDHLQDFIKDLASTLYLAEHTG